MAAAGTLLLHPRHSSSLQAHNLREAADCTWRTLLHLSRSRQLSAGRHSTTDAHRSCLTLPDATYTWRRIPTPAILSPSGTGSNTRRLPPRFSKHPCRLLISPLQYLAKEITGLQGKTGVTRAVAARRVEAQLCISPLLLSCTLARHTAGVAASERTQRNILTSIFIVVVFLSSVSFGRIASLSSRARGRTDKSLPLPT